MRKNKVKTDYSRLLKTAQANPFKARLLVYSAVFLFSAGVLVALNAFSKSTVRKNEIADWKLFTNVVESHINKYPHRTGLLIKNYKNNLAYEYNSERKFISASLIKLPVMCAVFQMAERNEISFDEKLIFRRNMRVGGSGNLKYAHVNSRHSVIDLVKMMIRDSDNTATKIVTERVGYGKLNELFVEMGLLNTNISPQSFRLNRNLVEDDSYTTPEDVVFLLDRIYKGEFVSSDASGEMLEILKLPKRRTRLGVHLPDEFELAHKTGLLRGACHDAGIVFTPSGDYIICVMTEENRSYRMAKRFISHIARLAFQTI